MLEKILSRSDVKEFLHKVLNDQKFSSKKDNSPGDTETNNIYSLFIVMDSIIKFSIIIQNELYFEEYLLQLKRILKRIDNYKDLEYGINKLICRLTAKVLNIDDMDDDNNKKTIISYIYDKYIVDGYVFYGFDSSMKDMFLKEGIDPRNIDIPGDKIGQINHFFNNRGFVNLIDYNDEDDAHIIITDSPSLAYFYAITSPKYLAQICANNDYMDDKHYDTLAFYRKDYESIRTNIINFSKYARLSLNEGAVMLQTATSEWNRLDISNSKPCIAFIKRKEINKNYLNDIRKILAASDNKDLILSVSDILSSRSEAEARYTPLTKEQFFISVMPSYKELYSVPEELIFQEESRVFLNEEYIDDLEEEINVNYLSNIVNNYGKSTIIGLLGMLMITLGATLIILLAYYS